MAGELSFESRGLPREDELLARVVVDLGLARQGDVLNAVDVAGRSRAKGDGKSLAQVLQDTGSLHPRFVKVVMKAVNNKLVAEGLPPAAVPEPPPPRPPTSAALERPPTGQNVAERASSPPTPPPARTPPAPPPKVAAPPPPAAGPFAPRAEPPPPAEGASASGPFAPRTQPPPSAATPPAPEPPPAARFPAEPREEQSEASRPEGPDVIMPEAIFFKQAPKGEGFSRRTKSEIAAAWAAKKKGGAPAQAAPPPSAPSKEGGGAKADRLAGSGGPPPPAAPSGKKEFTAADRLARIGRPPTPPSAEETLAVPGSGNPLAALVSPKKRDPGAPAPPAGPLAGVSGPADTGPGRRGPVDPRVGLGRPPEEKPAARPSRKKPPANPLSALVSPKQRRGQPKGPPKKRYKKRRKFAASGATQSINLEDLRAELGIESKAKAPQGAQVSDEDKRKSIELQAFVKRAVRSMLHQQCLDMVLKRRLMNVTAARLAEEAACRERDAQAVLDDWKMAGIMLVEPDTIEPEYKFSPAKADLSTIREFMVAWNDADWHNKLLGWIIEEEHR
ncbi:MAG: hypothetical protein ACYS9X_05385 [Planctomycetota bacterium]